MTQVRVVAALLWRLGEEAAALLAARCAVLVGHCVRTGTAYGPVYAGLAVVLLRAMAEAFQSTGELPLGGWGSPGGMMWLPCLACGKGLAALKETCLCSGVVTCGSSNGAFYYKSCCLDYLGKQKTGELQRQGQGAASRGAALLQSRPAMQRPSAAAIPMP